MVIGPIGSGNEYITFIKEDDGIVFVSCGKFFGTIDKFRKNILKTYTKGSIYRKQYLNIIEAGKYFFDA